MVMDDDVFNAEPTTSPKADTTAAVIDFVRIGLCIIVSYFRGERASIRGNGGGGTIASGAGGGGHLQGHRFPDALCHSPCPRSSTRIPIASWNRNSPRGLVL